MAKVRGATPYIQGANAFRDGVQPDQQPYGDTARGDEWISGWEFAQSVSAPEMGAQYLNGNREHVMSLIIDTEEKGSGIHRAVNLYAFLVARGYTQEAEQFREALNERIPS